MEMILIGVSALIALVVILVVFSYFGIWLRAHLSGVPVRWTQLIGMSLRKVNSGTIIDSMIMGTKAGIKLETDKLEGHYLAGGNVLSVVMALIAAAKASIKLDFEKAAAIDLAGRDVLDAVKTSVNPKVIDVPGGDSGKTVIEAVAGDGIQVKAKARVTVRANLDRLIGGATEETIIARVGEGIVTTIGSAETHKKVLENPDLISSKVLEKGLDAGTAFEILSIDIADIDVGKNIGAELQTDQAEADKKVAQARAEERRAMAIALEQEMKAKIQENRAKVVLAEAEVPAAMAEAFRQGHLGIMDYHRFGNIQSDTEMRNNISKLGNGGDKGKSKN